MAKDTELMKTAREYAGLAEEFDKDNRDATLEDLTFVYAEDQWDPGVKTKRGDRPTLNANDLPIFLDQLVGAQRMNRAGIKVHPVDNQSDPKKAEVIGGLIRNIEHLSDAHVAYDRALEFVAAGGYAGAIRVITQYEDEHLFDSAGNISETYSGDSAQNAFNQEIRVVPVDNPLNVLYDPTAKLWHKNDGRFMFYYDDIELDLFKERYPGKQSIDFDSDIPSNMKSWYNEGKKTMRVAEYFLKKPKGSKKVYLVADEEGVLVVTPDRPADPKAILKVREVEDFTIEWRLISGVEVLEGPIEIPGKMFPIIPVWGKEVNINGEKKLRGMFRYAKDPQRGYIYTQSAIIESVALAPKAPWIGTPKMFEGHEAKWRTANQDLHAFLSFNPDELAPGLMPKRTDPVQPSMGLIEQAATRQSEKRNVIGLQEASLGKKSNETSGRAIRERKQAGDSVTFAFIDNLNRGIRQVGRVILGMIPIIYAEERMVRIVGIDGKESMQQVNVPFENKDGSTGIIDLKVGKHDIVIQTGPSYGTQRIEFVDRLTEVMQYAPAIAPLLVPSIVEMMDIPHSEKIVKILETTLPPEARAAMGDEPPPSQEQIQQMVMQAVEQYKQSVEGQIEQMKTQQEGMKTRQVEMKTQQSTLSYEEEKIKLQEELIQLQKEIIKLEQVRAKPKEVGGAKKPTS